MDTRTFNMFYRGSMCNMFDTYALVNKKYKQKVAGFQPVNARLCVKTEGKVT